MIAPLLAALLALAPAAGAASRPDYLKAARSHYLELRFKGHVRVEVRFSEQSDPKYAGSPAYATYDFARRECTVFVNPAAVESFEFADAFAFRFMVYHELAHCELYAHPHELRALPDASERVNRLISDLVHLEFLHAEDARPVNGYSAYHETFADVKAVGLLLAEGHSRAKVDEIVRYRAANAVSFMDPHDTAGVFAGMLHLSWAAWSAARLDAEARSLADAFVPVSVLERIFGMGATRSGISGLVEGALRAPLSALRFEFSAPEDRAAVAGRLADVADAPQDAWREYARLVAEGGSPEQVVEAFFRARYGAGPRELAAEDAALLEALPARR